jgi:catechol 2,3-dioxygenase-like lactoylglutathione lyase family enzyme
MSLPRAYIEHVAIRVKDIDWHIGFFREVLGLGIRDELPPKDKIGRQVWLLGRRCPPDRTGWPCRMD